MSLNVSKESDLNGDAHTKLFVPISKTRLRHFLTSGSFMSHFCLSYFTRYSPISSCVLITKFLPFKISLVFSNSVTPSKHDSKLILDVIL